MNKKLKFGIIGCSSISERSTIPAIQKSSFAELEMIGSRSETKANMKNGQSRLQKQVNMFFVRNHPRYLLNLQKKWLILVLITKSEYWKVLCLGFIHSMKK